MKLSQLEKRIQQTLPNSRDTIQKWPKLLAPNWPERIGGRGKQMRPEHCINEIHGVTFPMNYASIMAEVSLPRWKHLYIWIFSPQEFSRTSLLYCAPQKILPHQLSHCKIQPKLQSWQNETILVVVIRAHSSATYSTFSRHLFYKPNRKNMAILIGIPT